MSENISADHHATPTRPADILFPNALNMRKNGRCTRCRKLVGPFRDELSAKEYRISSLCQRCQDALFQK